MPDHVRKQMRARVTGTTLASLSTVPSARVHESLVYPLQTLPAIRVGFEDEDINVASIGGGNRYLQRMVELVIELCAKEAATFEDTLDAIQQEVEVAIANDNTLNGLCKSIVPMRVETERSGESDKPVALRRLVFGVLYITAQNAPQTPQ
jgi:hypothetical protein